MILGVWEQRFSSPSALAPANYTVCPRTGIRAAIFPKDTRFGVADMPSEDSTGRILHGR